MNRRPSSRRAKSTPPEVADLAECSTLGRFSCALGGSVHAGYEQESRFMRRRSFVGMLGGLIAVAPTVGYGQSQKRIEPGLDRVRRIAVLIDGSAPHPLLEALGLDPKA